MLSWAVQLIILRKRWFGISLDELATNLAFGYAS
jgi:hypothetical protein